MFLALSLSDAEGQFLPGLAVEIKEFKVHGFTEGGLLADVLHLDGEWERVFLGGDTRPFAPMKFETLENVQGLRISSSYPSTIPVTKDEFRARAGKGATLTATGHFQRET